MWSWWKKLIDWIKKLWCKILCLFCKPPKYEPEKWNDERADAEECTCNLATETKIQCKNNCYNYAYNIQTDTFAQPGRTSGIICTHRSIVMKSVMVLYLMG